MCFESLVLEYCFYIIYPPLCISWKRLVIFCLCFIFLKEHFVKNKSGYKGVRCNTCGMFIPLYTIKSFANDLSNCLAHQNVFLSISNNPLCNYSSVSVSSPNTHYVANFQQSVLLITSLALCVLCHRRMWGRRLRWLIQI